MHVVGGIRRHTENLLVDLKASHLDNIRCERSASCTTAVFDRELLGKVGVCGGRGRVKCLNALAVL